MLNRDAAIAFPLASTASVTKAASTTRSLTSPTPEPYGAMAWLNRAVSYPEAFAENYARWSADMTEDLPFAEPAKEADGPSSSSRSAAGASPSQWPRRSAGG